MSMFNEMTRLKVYQWALLRVKKHIERFGQDGGLVHTSPYMCDNLLFYIQIHPELNIKTSSYSLKHISVDFPELMRRKPPNSSDSAQIGWFEDDLDGAQSRVAILVDCIDELQQKLKIGPYADYLTNK